MRKKECRQLWIRTGTKGIENPKRQQPAIDFSIIKGEKKGNNKNAGTWMSSMCCPFVAGRRTSELCLSSLRLERSLPETQRTKRSLWSGTVKINYKTRIEEVQRGGGMVGRRVEGRRGGGEEDVR
jgi:hypothetical protein